MKNIKYTVIFLVLTMLGAGCSGNGLMRDFDDIVDDNQGEGKEKTQLTIGSYNIRLLTTADNGERDWANRKQWVRKIVDDYDFDILGTQEGFITQIDGVVEDTDYNYVAVGRDNGVSQGETCAILYKRDKFGVEAQGTFWLSSTPDVPSSDWGASIRRICTWVRFKELESNRIFYVFNAHYDHQSLTAREESSKLILDRMKSIVGDYPVILTGDLNAEPNANSIRTLRDSGLIWDSKAVTKTPATGPEGTSYGYDLTKIPTSRIDYVFVSKSVDVLAYQVIDDDFMTGNIASDHLPVCVKVEF